ncbi:Hsp20/alpha crystallin family protein [Kiritimatiellota bacterium B12222]|nr:Hsp20/alpha crystallin family protein [Kiritimatiellota bacterium B12222]
MVQLRSPRALQEWVEELDRMSRRAEWAFREPLADVEATASALKIQDDKALIQLDLPGVEPSELDVSLEGDLLQIKATRADLHEEKDEILLRERSYGEFAKAFRLPWPVNEQGVNARFVNGVLRIELQRAPEAGPRHIQVQSN